MVRACGLTLWSVCPVFLQAGSDYSLGFGAVRLVPKQNTAEEVKRGRVRGGGDVFPSALVRGKCVQMGEPLAALTYRLAPSSMP